MNRDDIIRMARQAGLLAEDEAWVSLHQELIERFAALVAAAEREECAKMAEAFHRHGYDFTGDAELHDAIRARTEEQMK